MSLKKSAVWQHFTQEKDKKVKCKLCGQQLSVSNKSTCSLIRHMKRVHHIYKFSREEQPEVEIDTDTSEFNKNTSGLKNNTQNSLLTPRVTVQIKPRAFNLSQPTVTHFINNSHQIKKQQEIDQQHFEKQRNTSVSNPPKDESDLEDNINSDDSNMKNDYNSLVLYDDDDCAMDNEPTPSNENEAHLHNFTSDPLISVSPVKKCLKPFANRPQGSQATMRWQEVFSHYILCELDRYDYNDAQRD